MAMGSSSNNNASSSIAVVVPDVWCGPGIGLTADAAAAAASVDCVVSRTRMPVSGRTKVDAENKGNQREVKNSSFSSLLALFTIPVDN